MADEVIVNVPHLDPNDECSIYTEQTVQTALNGLPYVCTTTWCLNHEELISYQIEVAT